MISAYVLSIICLCHPGSDLDVAVGAPFGGEYVKVDPRLKQPITLNVRSTRLGALLDRVSKASNISIRCGERDGAYDVRMSVHCRNIPLLRILDAVWSAVSYRSGRWEVAREGEGPEWSYRFLQPRAARELRTEVRQWVQGRLERNIRVLEQAVDSSPESKAEALKQVFGNDPEQVSPGYWQGRLWPDVRAFKETLSGDERAAVLSGKTLRVGFDRLPTETREHLLSLYWEANRGARRVRNGREVPVEPPAFAEFSVRRYGSTPAVFLFVDGVGAPAGFGGFAFESQFRDYMIELWKLDSDSVADAALHSQITLKPSVATRVVEASEETGSPRIDELARRIEDIHRASQVPIVARLPEDDESVTVQLEPIRDTTLEEYWKQLWRGSTMVKWHTGVQIISTNAWPLEDPPVPDRILRETRQDVRAGRLLSFDRLIDLAAGLTQKQLLRHQKELPVFGAIARYQRLLALFKRYPNIAREAMRKEGAAMTPMVAEPVKEVLPASMADQVSNGRARRLTITILTGQASGRPWREVGFWIWDAQYKRIGGVTFEETAISTNNSGKGGAAN